MKKMDYQNVKGTQDFLPNEEVIRRKVRRTLEDIFIQYGCHPLETPTLNYTRLLASKYAGGAEILEEMYTLSDRGKRELALRYDLTIPFAKVVAMNPNLKMPFKRYEIGKVFRDGPIKTGRLREFTQCDVDIVGVDSQVGEAELLMMAVDAFEKLEIEVSIEYNNRKLLAGLLEIFETPIEQVNTIILTLDKLNKIGVNGIIKELDKKGVSPSTIASIQSFIDSGEKIDIEYFDQYFNLNASLDQGISEIKELTSIISYVGIEKQCCFNPFLARGLEIYSGTVYEIFLPKSNFKSSIGSGGRYDNAIGGLLGTGETYSTIGISFGLDSICTALKMMQTSDNSSEEVNDFFIIPLNTQKEALLVARQLRNQGAKVEIDMATKKLGKALQKANNSNVEQVIILGEDEIKNNEIRIKNMNTGEEERKTFQFNL